MRKRKNSFPVREYGRSKSVMNFFSWFLPTFVLLVPLILSSEAAVARIRPHVIFIAVEDLGWDDVGLHGSPQIPTPNIDAIAASGIVLNNYYVSPTTFGTKAEFMTGKYATRLGVQHGVLHNQQPLGLPIGEKILPQYLKDLGYSTHAVGKWALGFYAKDMLPTKRGFDSFFGMLTSSSADYFTHSAYDGFYGLDLMNNEEPVRNETGTYSTELFTKKAVQVIKSHDKTKPLFLYLAHQAVHSGNADDPLQVPDVYTARVPHIKNDKRRKFAGMVSCVDDSVLNVTVALSSRGMLENSIIIFTTAGGGAAGGMELNMGSNYPLRGSKMTVWEGGMRAVGFVYSSYLQHSSRVSEEMFHATDWLPTILALAGGNPQAIKGLDGFNIWDSLSLEGVMSPRFEILHQFDPLQQSVCALRVGDYKILLNQDIGYYGDWYPRPAQIGELRNLSKPITLPNAKIACDKNYPHPFLEMHSPPCNPSKKPCLFNIQWDPCEYHNLAQFMPNTLKVMLDRLYFYRSKVVHPFYPAYDTNSDPELHGGIWRPWGFHIKTSQNATNDYLNQAAYIATATPFSSSVEIIPATTESKHQNEPSVGKSEENLVLTASVAKISSKQMSSLLLTEHEQELHRLTGMGPDGEEVPKPVDQLALSAKISDGNTEKHNPQSPNQQESKTVADVRNLNPNVIGAGSEPVTYVGANAEVSPGTDATSQTNVLHTAAEMDPNNKARTPEQVIEVVSPNGEHVGLGYRTRKTNQTFGNEFATFGNNSANGGKSTGRLEFVGKQMTAHVYSNDSAATPSNSMDVAEYIDTKGSKNTNAYSVAENNISFSTVNESDNTTQDTFYHESGPREQSNRLQNLVIPNPAGTQAKSNKSDWKMPSSNVTDSTISTKATEAGNSAIPEPNLYQSPSTSEYINIKGLTDANSYTLSQATSSGKTITHLNVLQSGQQVPNGSESEAQLSNPAISSNPTLVSNASSASPPNYPPSYYTPQGPGLNVQPYPPPPTVLSPPLSPPMLPPLLPPPLPLTPLTSLPNEKYLYVGAGSGTASATETSIGAAAANSFGPATLPASRPPAIQNPMMIAAPKNFAGAGSQGDTIATKLVQSSNLGVTPHGENEMIVNFISRPELDKPSKPTFDKPQNPFSPGGKSMSSGSSSGAGSSTETETSVGGNGGAKSGSKPGPRISNLKESGTLQDSNVSPGLKQEPDLKDVSNIAPLKAADSPRLSSLHKSFEGLPFGLATGSQSGLPSLEPSSHRPFQSVSDVIYDNGALQQPCVDRSCIISNPGSQITAKDQPFSAAVPSGQVGTSSAQALPVDKDPKQVVQAISSSIHYVTDYVQSSLGTTASSNEQARDKGHAKDNSTVKTVQSLDESALTRLPPRDKLHKFFGSILVDQKKKFFVQGTATEDESLFYGSTSDERNDDDVKKHNIGFNIMLPVTLKHVNQAPKFKERSKIESNYPRTGLLPGAHLKGKAAIKKVFDLIADPEKGKLKSKVSKVASEEHILTSKTNIATVENTHLRGSAFDLGAIKTHEDRVLESRPAPILESTAGSSSAKATSRDEVAKDVHEETKAKVMSSEGDLGSIVTLVGKIKVDHINAKHSPNPRNMSIEEANGSHHKKAMIKEKVPIKHVQQDTTETNAANVDMNGPSNSLIVSSVIVVIIASFVVVGMAVVALVAVVARHCQLGKRFDAS